MNDANEELVGTVVDTSELWLCGSSYFPQIATHYATSGALLGRASELGDSAFSRAISGPRTAPGATGPGPVPYHLNQVRDELHRLMGESVDNLFATGDALERVAWAYEESDTDSGGALRETVDSALDANANDPNENQYWTDDERQTDIRDKMDVPPAES